MNLRLCIGAAGAFLVSKQIGDIRGLSRRGIGFEKVLHRRRRTLLYLLEIFISFLILLHCLCAVCVWFVNVEDPDCATLGYVCA